MTRTLLLAIAGVLLALPRSAPDQQVRWPEAVLPETRWAVSVVARDVQFKAGSVFAQTRGSVLSLDAVSGQRLWEQKIGNDDSARLADPMLVLDGKLAVAVGKRVLILDTQTGTRLAEAMILGGSARMLAGPPLVAETEWRSIGSVVLEIDVKSGKILASRRAGFVDTLWVKDGIVIVRAYRATPEEAPEMHKLTGFSASGLERLWSFRAESPELVEIAGIPFVSVIAPHDRGGKVMPVDLKTGRLGAPLPRRGPVKSEWGGATWELESIDAGRDYSRMRRNDPASGRALWTLVVPFAVSGFLREGNRLFLCGGDDREHALAEVDWDSGRPVQLVRPAPFIRTLFRNLDSFVAWTFDDRVLSFIPSNGP